MKRTIPPLIAAATLLLGAAAAHAHAPGQPANIDQRQHAQHARIAQGVASGQLTPREAHRLGHEQARIAHVEAHARADGVVTAGERHHLHGLQDRASRHIRLQKHDRQQWRG